MNQPPTNVVEFTVSELAFALRRMVEENYEHVRVRGEISGFRGVAASGHCYFTLKDDRACLDAVLWKTTLQRLRFKPEDGLEMVATGRLTTFPSRSRYQIIIEHLEPAGAGALMALLEERRKKLAGEGLFDASRKRPLPYLPRVIGVVTSPTGAVIRDILHRLRDRFPTRVLVWPVKVQGEGAAEEVAAAIRGFNAIAPEGAVPLPDLLIVARGGGSIEDLWAFNEEVTVRSVAASRVPVISAVGHETDWTLVDHAADLRAPTPTGAAELAVPVRAELLAQTRELASRHELAHRRSMESLRRALSALVRALPTLDDLLALRRQNFDEIAGRLMRSLRTEVATKRQSYAGSAGRLSPFLLRRTIAHKRELLGARAGRIALASAALVQDARRATSRIAARLDIESVARIVLRQRQRTEQFGRLLRAFSYEAVLDRGYALVVGPGGATVRSADQVRTGDPLMIRVAEGDFGATVSGPGRPKSRRSLPRRTAGEGQGELL
ncbi:MAG: exodeoxyribonuclease VII large subunit [Propylenella sp.]